jgi:hypothetical protein
MEHSHVLINKSAFYSIVLLLMAYSSFSQSVGADHEEANTIVITIIDEDIELATNRFIKFLASNKYLILGRRTNESTLTNHSTGKVMTSRLTSEPQIHLRGIEKNESSIGINNTYRTGIKTLPNTMHGPYSAWIRFEVKESIDGNIEIVVWGYSTSNAMKEGKSDLRMQNRGKGLNWSQRSLFREVDKMLSDFSGVVHKSYLFLDID